MGKGTTSTRPTEETDVDAVTQLRAEVDQLRAQITTMDREAFDVERYVEHHEAHISTLRGALALVMMDLFRPEDLEDRESDAGVAFRMLYPERIPNGNGGRQLPASWLYAKCSPRRWRQFGSLADVVQLAKPYADRLRRSKPHNGREWILRDLLHNRIDITPTRFDGR